MIPSRPPSFSRFHSVATRAGHEIVWLLIAVLFCFVEAAVLVTELRPGKLFRRAATGTVRKPALTSAPVASRA